MSRFATRILVAGALIIVIVAGGLAIQRGRHPHPAIAEASETLSPALAEDGGTEPVALPPGPILKNSASAPTHLAMTFGYKIGPTAYAYKLGLSFAPNEDKGTMDLGEPRGASETLEQFPVERRWSDTRHAYLVAVSHDLSKQKPPVPSLCVRAVIGASKTSFDLSNASLCVMQRDGDGGCHPSTLACGLIR